MQSVRILGTRHAFSPLPARVSIVNKPVWLAVGLSADGMAGRASETYPLLTSELEHGGRCLVALQNRSDFRKLVAAAGETPGTTDISVIRSCEGDAHKTAALLRMSVLVVFAVHDEHVTGWVDEMEPYL